MSGFRKMLLTMIGMMILVTTIVNLIVIPNSRSDSNRNYIVEISRLAYQAEQTDSFDLSSCRYVKNVVLCEAEEDVTASSKYDYVIRKVGDKLYRFEYENKSGNDVFIILMVNAVLCITYLFLFGVLLYVYRQIIKPFHEMEKIPYELARGNLATQLPESKSRYFGRFIWGTNMLRESIEDRRKEELELHREKKTLLLSLTHDIKTPLSAIKLNAQALEKGLYSDTEKQKKAAQIIVERVNEIESYVTEMVSAAREDFLKFDVKEEEFYMSEVIRNVKEYYRPKMQLNKTDFVVEEFSDGILKGDRERLTEVLQNLLENAIKYGDGKRITLSFGKEENCRLITVSNSGEPVKKEEISHLFDSFYRGSNVGDKAGSGLGLYICRSLMHRMNGEIFAKQNDDAFSVTVVVRES